MLYVSVWQVCDIVSVDMTKSMKIFAPITLSPQHRASQWVRYG